MSWPRRDKLTGHKGELFAGAGVVLAGASIEWIRRRVSKRAGQVELLYNGEDGPAWVSMTGESSEGRALLVLAKSALDAVDG